jgi:hypothetical protein
MSATQSWSGPCTLKSRAATSLAARQAPHRLAGGLAREQEVLQVAVDVFLSVSDRDVVAAIGDGVRDVRAEVELPSLLIEVGDLEMGAVPDRAFLRP